MKITLFGPREFQAIICYLHGDTVLYDAFEVLRQIETAKLYVLSNASYQARIDWDDREIPSSIQIYLNGELIRYNKVDEADSYCLIGFQSDQYTYGNIFRDCYGFVRFEICFEWAQGRMESYWTDYIAVMLRDNKANASLQKMAEYVYEKHQDYMWKKNTLPAGAVNLTKSDERSLDVQIELIRSVVQVYEHNLPYFQTRPHTRIKDVYEVDDFHKLQTISPKTLQYIAQHPDELVPYTAKSAITVKNRGYIPRKTLILSEVQSRDCYENRVVIGFLKTVIMEVEKLQKNLNTFLVPGGNTAPVVEGYVSSTLFILQTTRHSLEQKRNTILELQARLNQLYWIYKAYFPIAEENIYQVPRLTAVFRMSSQYRIVYNVIRQWFGYGSYDFSRESFLLPLLMNHQLYEYYVLLQMISGFEASGFTFIRDESTVFDYQIRTVSQVNLDHINTFVFKNDKEEKILLYYQPVVWGQRYSDSIRNGISIQRNTTATLGHEDGNEAYKRRNAFYTPDYIIKYDFKGEERYIIADAKFQTYDRVWNRQIGDVSFKYQFSISPTKNRAIIKGVLLLYGKSLDKSCMVETVHDIMHDPTAADFWLTSMTESENCTKESKRIMIQEIIQKLQHE